MAAYVDLCSSLSDEWWEIAKSTQTSKTTWKIKFECLKEIFALLSENGSDDINVELKCDILRFPDKEADEIFGIMVHWLANENHVFTKIGVLRLLPKLIDAMPLETLTKYQQPLLETLMTKQWAEKKTICLELVTPALIKFWLRV